MGRVSFGQYGNYTTPQLYTLAGGTAPAIILGQWWYDFSRIAEANIDIFMGVEHRFVSYGGTGGPVLAKYGLFVLPDGDPLVGDLFFGIIPDVVKLIPSNLTVFHGYDAAATIANPGSVKQLLLAVVPQATSTMATTPHNYAWRSALVDIIGV